MQVFDRIPPGPLSPRTAHLLNQIAEQVEKALNISADPPIHVKDGPDGLHLTFDLEDAILVEITEGNQPYGWRELYFDPSGGIRERPANLGQRTGTLDPMSHPAYELNGSTSVRPGTIVWLRRRFLNNSQHDVEYWFDAGNEVVVAKVSQEGAPSTTLAAPLTDSATVAVIASAEDFPGRNGYLALIDDYEVVEVEDGAGGEVLVLNRGLENTDPDKYGAGTSFTLAGAYKWIEQEPHPDGNGKWQDKDEDSRLEGDFRDQPAYEINRSTLVPDDTVVLLERRVRSGAGESTLIADVDADSVVIQVTERSVFPATGPYYIRVGFEWMKVIGGFGSAGPGPLIVTRGVYRSSKAAHKSGESVVEAVVEWCFEYCCKDGDGGGGPWCADFTIGLGGSACAEVGDGQEEWCADFELSLSGAACADTGSAEPEDLCVTFTASLGMTSCADYKGDDIGCGLRLNNLNQYEVDLKALTEGPEQEGGQKGWTGLEPFCQPEDSSCKGCAIKVRKGCGLKEGDDNRLDVDVEALAGDGLDFETDAGVCLLKILTGCGAKIGDSGDNMGKLMFNAEDVVGDGMGGAFQGLKVGEGDCDIEVATSCGLFINESGELAIAPEDLLGPGLEQGIGECNLQVKGGCGISVGEDGVSVDVADLIAADGGLEAGAGDCDLKVKGGCGISVGAGGVEVDPEDLLGDGLELGQEGCEIAVKGGCGITVDLDGVSVDATALAGTGMTVGAGCSIQPDLGCGLKIADQGDDIGKIIVDLEDIAGDGLVGDEDDCKLKAAIECGLKFVDIDGVNHIAVDNEALAGDGDGGAAAGLKAGDDCKIEIDPGCGLQFDGDGKLEINPADLAGDGLEVGDGCKLNVVAAPVDLNAGCGIVIGQFMGEDFIDVVLEEIGGDGFEIDPGAGPNGCDLLKIKVDPDGGLDVDGNGVRVIPGPCINVDAGGVGVDVDGDAGVECGVNGLAVKLGDCLEFDEDGNITLKLADGGGLVCDGDGLALDMAPAMARQFGDVQVIESRVLDMKDAEFRRLVARIASRLPGVMDAL